jgi:hypothetical protein
MENILQEQQRQAYYITQKSCELKRKRKKSRRKYQIKNINTTREREIKRDSKQL